MLQTYRQRLLDFYAKHETRLEIGVFIGGFVLDALLMSDVDDWFTILQQVIYLVAIASLLHYEILFRMQKWRPSGFVLKYWSFRVLLLHFCLGALLNMYSLFYIKSSSLISSLIFLLLMIGIILANELPSVKKSNVSLKFSLFAICLFSFFSIMFPLLLGFVGQIPFLLAVLATFGIFYLQFILLKERLPDLPTLSRVVLAPGFSVLSVFAVFYIMGWIPPVPLSVVEQGIYHGVEKTEEGYILSTNQRWWNFWHSGDQAFMAQTGDVIYYYTQIYSPARFSDEIYIQWSSKDKNGKWQYADRIPMKIVGGRKTGFRGYAMKANYHPGDWRVQLLTGNGQEISRLSFDVTISEETEDRVFTRITK